VENEVGEIPMVLVQNKIDLVDQAQVTGYVVLTLMSVVLTTTNI